MSKSGNGKKKKDQNETKPCRQVSGCQFLKEDFTVLLKMKGFPKFPQWVRK